MDIERRGLIEAAHRVVKQDVGILEDQESTIKAKGIPRRPALDAMKSRKANTMTTPAAPPRAGRTR
jgi:hypothetical protein